MSNCLEMSLESLHNQKKLSAKLKISATKISVINYGLFGIRVVDSVQHIDIDMVHQSSMVPLEEIVRDNFKFNF